MLWFAIPSSLVLLTGCCGYIGARVAHDLLAAGHRVRGTSREPDYASSLYAGLAEEVRSRLEIVHAELLDSESWRGLAADCTTVIHTACPVATEVGTPEREMLDPALIGTENVVREAARAGSVGRFIYMSSIVTLLDHHRASSERVSRLGPSHWNETASPATDPYAFAKVRAERRARELVAELMPRAQFASVLPGPVIGPPVHGARLPASIDKTLSPLLDGRLKAGSVDLWLGLVDVRDVAAACVALTSIERERLENNSRFICAMRPVPRMQQLADAIRTTFPEYEPKLPKRALPVPRFVLLPIMRMMLEREEYSYTSAMLGRELDYDTSLTIGALGVRFRSLEESVRDTLTWLKGRSSGTGRDRR